MEISCKDAEKLMDAVFAGSEDIKTLKKSTRLIKHHCKNCELCKIKFFILGSTNVDLSEEEIEQILDENYESERKVKTRNTIILILIILLLLAMLFGLFSYVTLLGKNTFLARIKYGVSETFTESTSEHPSFEEVEFAVERSKQAFEYIGKGAVMLSLTYNDELTYSEGFEDTIVLDLSYYRMFATEGSNGKANFINNSYSIPVKYYESEENWYVQNIYKREQ